jgi:4-hydroxybenzoate polyprenyltransferase/phosphoserine phosphatase
MTALPVSRGEPDFSQDSPKPLSPKPLVIDLDGTLLKTDFLWETALAYLRLAPWRVFMLLYWLAHGRARLKAELSRRAEIDPMLAPEQRAVVALAMRAKEEGREVVIATATDARIADKMLVRFPFIDRVLASDGRVNLRSDAKLAVLRKNFPDGFDYAGDSSADLPVWRGADGVIVVNASPAVLRAASAIREPIVVIPREKNRFRTALKSLRPHQWAKNGLILAPLALAGMIGDPAALSAAFFALASLCLIASATYLINDLVDIEDDRRHWTKRNRPLASGDLPIPHAVVLAVAGLAAGVVLAAQANAATVAGVALYLVVTLAYSFRLKRAPLVDVLTLAGLFTLRLAIGCFAIGAPISPWLLTFSMFLFVSLSLAKRHTELARSGGRKTVRGYRPEDEVLVLGLGLSALVAAILVFVLYLTQEAFVAAHLASPRLLWAFPPALFLVAGRVWLLSGRGELHDDPVAFAVKDRMSLAVVGALGAVFLAAWLGTPQVLMGV